MKTEIVTTLLREKVTAIVRGIAADSLRKTADALLAGGVHSIEVTFDTPGAAEMIRTLKAEYADQMLVGAGTVLDTETCRTAILAGADFVLSPTLNTDVITMCSRYGKAAVPGVMTPTEILTAIEAGADIVGVGDAAASLIGPAMYEEFAIDYEKKLIGEIHRSGALAKLHICGNINPILERAAQTGADILDCDHMVDMARAGELMRGKGTVCGNFDPVSVALQGTPEDVRRASIYCAGLAENSIVAAGCEIPIDTDPANLLATHEALVSLGC